MAIDLNNLSPKELQALIADAEAQMKHARAVQVQSVREKIEALLDKNGFTLEDVYPSRGKAAGKTAKRVVAPKYRNPADPSQTWSGRGRQPLWFANALKGRGVTIESLLIEQPTRPAASAKNAAARKELGKKAAKKAIRRGGKTVVTSKPS